MKYIKLAEHLSRKRREKQLSLAFSEIEKIIGTELPRSAYVHETWWNNNPHHSWSDGWLHAGWKKSIVDLKARVVTFTRFDSKKAAEGIRNREKATNAVPRKDQAQPWRSSKVSENLRQDLFYKATGRFRLDKYSEEDVDAIVSLMEWAYERGRLDESLD